MAMRRRSRAAAGGGGLMGTRRVGRGGGTACARRWRSHRRRARWCGRRRGWWEGPVVGGVVDRGQGPGEGRAGRVGITLGNGGWALFHRADVLAHYCVVNCGPRPDRGEAASLGIALPVLRTGGVLP